MQEKSTAYEDIFRAGKCLAFERKIKKSEVSNRFSTGRVLAAHVAFSKSGKRNCHRK
jgi:hypothetical protein